MAEQTQTKKVEITADVFERPIFMKDSLTILRFERAKRGDVVELDHWQADALVQGGGAQEPGASEQAERDALEARLSEIKARQDQLNAQADREAAVAEAERDPEVSRTAGSPDADLSVPQDNDGNAKPKSGSGNRKS